MRGASSTINSRNSAVGSSASSGGSGPTDRASNLLEMALSLAREKRASEMVESIALGDTPTTANANATATVLGPEVKGPQGGDSGGGGGGGGGGASPNAPFATANNRASNKQTPQSVGKQSGRRATLPKLPKEMRDAIAGWDESIATLRSCVCARTSDTRYTGSTSDIVRLVPAAFDRHSLNFVRQQGAVAAAAAAAVGNRGLESRRGEVTQMDIETCAGVLRYCEKNLAGPVERNRIEMVGTLPTLLEEVRNRLDQMDPWNDRRASGFDNRRDDRVRLGDEAQRWRNRVLRSILKEEGPSAGRNRNSGNELPTREGLRRGLSLSQRQDPWKKVQGGGVRGGRDDHDGGGGDGGGNDNDTSGWKAGLELNRIRESVSNCIQGWAWEGTKGGRKKIPPYTCRNSQGKQQEEYDLVAQGLVDPRDVEDVTGSAEQVSALMKLEHQLQVIRAHVEQQEHVAPLVEMLRNTMMIDNKDDGGGRADVVPPPLSLEQGERVLALLRLVNTLSARPGGARKLLHAAIEVEQDPYLGINSSY